MIRTIVLAVCIIFGTSIAHAYFEDYPPFTFGQKPPATIKANLLVDCDHSDYKSSDGKVVAHLTETPDAFKFFLKVDGVTLQENKERSTPFAYSVYESDLDKNGLKDYIIFSSNRGCGLASQISVVDVYLGKADGSYDVVNYETFGAGIEDFTDYNKDGNCEVILMDMYGGKDHNYFAYSIHRIKDGKFVDANNEFKGFPKFIWYTEKNNDKDTTHLTPEERQQFIKTMDSKIKYSLLKK